MLPAIQLNNNTFLDTDEVCNKWSYRMLTPELVTVQSAVSQMTPEQLLSIRHALSQGSCSTY